MDILKCNCIYEHHTDYSTARSVSISWGEYLDPWRRKWRKAGGYCI